MAKPKRNLRSKRKNNRDLQRPTDKRSPKKRFLIICEGEKTEPNYFESFPVPKNVELAVDGIAKDPSKIVAYAGQLAVEHDYEVTGSDEDLDQVWCVFDRDSWTLQDFKNAIQNAKRQNFYVAYSNEAFELWYVLHFEYLNTGIPRNDYCKKLSALMGKKYQKNSEDIYEDLIDKQQTAIKRAKNLLDQYEPNLDPANDNPSTTVHALVEKLVEAMS